MLLCADLVLALAPGIAAVLAGSALWGLHMACTQGLLATLVADAAPAELRGTAFGCFNLLTGVALLIASIVAGQLWDAVGALALFLRAPCSRHLPCSPAGPAATAHRDLAGFTCGGCRQSARTGNRRRPRHWPHAHPFECQ